MTAAIDHPTCLFRGCYQRTQLHPTRTLYGPFCEQHEHAQGYAWGFCASPGCGRWFRRREPVFEYCAFHDGEDYLQGSHTRGSGLKHNALIPYANATVVPEAPSSIIGNLVIEGGVVVQNTCGITPTVSPSSSAETAVSVHGTMYKLRAERVVPPTPLRLLRPAPFFCPGCGNGLLAEEDRKTILCGCGLRWQIFFYAYTAGRGPDGYLVEQFRLVLVEDIERAYGPPKEG